MASFISPWTRSGSLSRSTPVPAKRYGSIDLEEGARFDGAPRKVHRGVSYWTDGKGDDRIVFATPGFNLVALNAKTGVPVPTSGRVALWI